MADHVEELLAYFLIPDRWIPAWFLWIGGGHNGKTFLTKLLALLLDDDAIESDRIQAFSSDNFGMERLIGKTLILDDDLITGTKIPDGFVKKVSESKLISANRKKQDIRHIHKSHRTFVTDKQLPRNIGCFYRNETPNLYSGIPSPLL